MPLKVCFAQQTFKKYAATANNNEDSKGFLGNIRASGHDYPVWLLQG